MRDISHKITGATGILLFYTWLKTKQLKLQPNKSNDLCSCFAIELMGKEVIESAKAVVIKKTQAALNGREPEIAEKMARLEEAQCTLQDQMTELAAKLDLVLLALEK